MSKSSSGSHLEDPRIQFYADVETGKLSLQDSVRGMRKILNMTQPEYAKLVGVAPRIIIDLERGVGNPTLKTLEKIGHPFRLKINFIRGQTAN
jgi:DNA-binding XRE family transcriptional regulator